MGTGSIPRELLIYLPKGNCLWGRVWKTPPWSGSSTSCASGALGKEGKNPTNPTLTNPLQPFLQLQEQAHGCDGVSSVLTFWGQVLWDELEHQERKIPPLLVNTKGFFQRNWSGSCFQLQPGSSGTPRCPVPGRARCNY